MKVATDPEHEFGAGRPTTLLDTEPASVFETEPARVFDTVAVGRVRQLLRYGAVSLISTATSMIVLGVLVATRTITPGWANVAATAVGTIPSFELNRRWVWGRTDERRLLAQAGPFCALSFAGLALSTLTVSLAGRWATHAAMTGTTRTAVVELASVAAFGTLWVAQFLILDRVLFGRSSRRRASLDPA